MAKIENLTPEQERQLVEWREKWLAIGRATGEADIEAIRPAINDFYKRIGRDTPYIWRVSSPMMAILVINVLRDHLVANLRANLRSHLGDNLWSNLRANLRSHLGDNLWSNLGDNLWADLRDNLWADLRDNLWANLRDNLEDNLEANLGDNLRHNLWGDLRSHLFDNLQIHLRENFWTRLRSHLEDNPTFEFIGTDFWGSHDSYWIAYYLFSQCYLKSDIYDSDDLAKLQGWATLAQNCFWWYAYDGICFVSDRPTAYGLDTQGRLHGDSAMCMEFADGYGFYAWHGVRVSEDIIMHPETITIEQIDNERNAEMRRILLTRFGEARYIEESGIEPVHQDDFGRLYIKQIPMDEPLVMVRVLNSTPEHDGSIKPYWLRVDPNAYEGDARRYAKAAVASTWRWPSGGMVFKRWQDYQPIQET